jgi:BMFP domain-containing protein YqiC
MNSNRFFDDMAKLMTDAAGAAQGVQREMEGVARGFVEKFLRDMNLVTREEFEVVRAMAEKAREENDALRTALSALEEKIAKNT